MKELTDLNARIADDRINNRKISTQTSKLRYHLTQVANGTFTLDHAKYIAKCIAATSPSNPFAYDATVSALMVGSITPEDLETRIKQGEKALKKKESVFEDLATTWAQVEANRAARA